MYNDMPSPLSNAEKLAESSRREEEVRREREREESTKSYHDRESRSMSSQQRKGEETHDPSHSVLNEFYCPVRPAGPENS